VGSERVASASIFASSSGVSTQSAALAFCSSCSGLVAPAITLAGGSPVGGTYSGTGVSAGKFDPAVAGVGLHTITVILIALAVHVSSALG